MKDLKDLIQIADVYGKESAVKQGQIDEGLYDWFKSVLGLGDDEAKAAEEAAKEAGANPEVTPDQGQPSGRLDTKGQTPDQADTDQGIDADDNEPTLASTISPLRDFMGKDKGGLANDADEVEAIKELQGLLGITADGKYGPGTKAAVEKFQQENNLTVDGDAGSQTITMLLDKKKLKGSDAPGADLTKPGQDAPRAQGEVEPTDSSADDADSQDSGTPPASTTAAPQSDAELDADSADSGTPVSASPQVQQAIDRYMELLRIQSGESPSIQNASRDFRDMISLVESMLNERSLTNAEKMELIDLHTKYAKEIKAKDPKAFEKGKAIINNKTSTQPTGDKNKTSYKKPKNNDFKGLFKTDQQTPDTKGSQLPAGAKPFQGSYNKKTHKLVNIKGKTYVVPRTSAQNKNTTNPNRKKPNNDFKGMFKTDQQDPNVQMASKQNTGNNLSEASMNISMNGQDAAEVAELLDMLKKAGVEAPKNLPMISPEPMPSLDKDMDEKPCPICGKVHLGAGTGCMGEAEVEEDWDNTPEEDYADHKYMTHDLSGGINRQKKSYPATQDGDNPMALEASIKNQLLQALEEKKKSPAGGPACWDGKKIHPTKPTKMKDGKRVNNCIDADGSDGK